MLLNSEQKVQEGDATEAEKKTKSGSIKILIIKIKAMNTNQKDPGCCGSDSGCCGGVTDWGCC